MPEEEKYISRARQQLIRDAKAAGFDVVEGFGGLVDIRLQDAITNRLINGVRLYRNGTVYSHVSARCMHSYQAVRKSLHLEQDLSR